MCSDEPEREIDRFQVWPFSEMLNPGLIRLSTNLVTSMLISEKARSSTCLKTVSPVIGTRLQQELAQQLVMNGTCFKAPEVGRSNQFCVLVMCTDQRPPKGRVYRGA